MEYNVGDIVKTKKQHPCGSKLWELTRVGVDFKMKCLGCGHVIILERPKALKAITKKKKMRVIHNESLAFWEIKLLHGNLQEEHLFV